jgi:methylmalonyl-CoA mutase
MTTAILEDTSGTAAEWRRRVEAALKGRPADTLRTTSFEGIAIEPLYGRVLTEPPRALRQTPGRWRVVQRMDQPAPGDANATALRDLENGADGLVLVTQGAAAARGFGVSIGDLADLDRALDGVEIDLIGLRLDAGSRALEMASLLAELAHRRRLSAAQLAVAVGHDPIGLFARSGVLPQTPAAIGTAAATAAGRLRAGGFDGALFLADGRPYHEAGAGEAQELAAVLATAVAYIRWLAEAGLSLEEARAEIGFLLAADADEFFTLAKFRALRRLWARVETACGLTPKPITLHAETAWRCMTRHDPTVNILRATIGMFGAGLGGADDVTALPHTLPLGLPDSGARRLARNAQLILLDEARLDAVADPAAGAGGFEALTEALCLKAWALFQAIEAAGGMVAALETNLVQDSIALTRAARNAAIATGKAAITGTSAFAVLSEPPTAVLVPAPAVAPVDAPTAPVERRGAPLVSTRDAAPFERLRAQADSMAAGGRRPALLLVTVGATPQGAARAAFVTNVLAAGGIAAVTDAAASTPETAAAAVQRAGTRGACLCAGDSGTDDELAGYVAALKAAGASRVYLAQAPGLRENALRAAGIDGFLFEGCNALALLQDVLAAL